MEPIPIEQPFLARYKLHNKNPPVKGYLHMTGLFAFREQDGESLTTIYDRAGRFLEEQLEQGREHYKDSSFLIAALWGDEGERVIDLFGYHDFQRWPGNPGVQNWVIRDGVYRREQDICCEDMIIILGQEATLRRETRSLDEYMRRDPPAHSKSPFRIDNLSRREQ